MKLHALIQTQAYSTNTHTHVQDWLIGVGDKCGTCSPVGVFDSAVNIVLRADNYQVYHPSHVNSAKWM